MFKNIFGKTFYEKRWALLVWTAGLFAMTLITMAFYPFFKNAGFDEVIQNAPKSIQSFLGNAANYKSVTGYVDQQIFALRLPMLTIIMAVTLFVGIGVGDEDRGTLETLLAQPVTRAKAFWQKFAAGAVIIALAHIGIFFGVIASYPMIHGSMNTVNLVAATFGCWLITMTFAALTYAIGAATGKRGLTIGIASGLAFFSYLISSMAPAVDKLAVTQKFTPFYYYNVPSIALHGLKFTNILVLVALAAALLLVSLVLFRKRDLVRD